MTQKANESKDILTKALIKFRSEIDPIKKESFNKFFDSSYADINGILKEIGPVLDKCGLSIHHSTIPSTQEDSQRNIIGYCDTHLRCLGTTEELKTTFPIIVDHKNVKNYLHAFGAGETYARRYGILALLDLPCEDDDGNSHTGEMVESKQQNNVQKQYKKHEKPKDNVVLSENQKNLKKMIDKIAFFREQDFQSVLEEYSSFVGNNGKTVKAKNIDAVSDSWAQSLCKKVKEEYESIEDSDGLGYEEHRTQESMNEKVPF